MLSTSSVTAIRPSLLAHFVMVQTTLQIYGRFIKAGFLLKSFDWAF